MTGETDLKTLLRSMSASLEPGTYVFATLPVGEVPAGLSPRMMFLEAEGTTLILLREQADAHGIAYEFPCRMITLNVHSALEAVGFIAHISSRLAEEGMGVNPVSAYFHDHLFVPEGREEQALEVLRKIAAE